MGAIKNTAPLLHSASDMKSGQLSADIPYLHDGNAKLRHFGICELIPEVVLVKLRQWGIRTCAMAGSRGLVVLRRRHI
eukprot:scaffold455682_cov48-Prasinocladus_malaysianus.AAC.1